MEFSLIFQYRVQLFQVELIRDIGVVFGRYQRQKVLPLHLIQNILLVFSVRHVFCQKLFDALVKIFTARLDAPIRGAVKTEPLVAHITRVTRALAPAEKTVVNVRVAYPAYQLAQNAQIAPVLVEFFRHGLAKQFSAAQHSVQRQGGIKFFRRFEYGRVISAHVQPCFPFSFKVAVGKTQRHGFAVFVFYVLALFRPAQKVGKIELQAYRRFGNGGNAFFVIRLPQRRAGAFTPLAPAFFIVFQRGYKLLRFAYITQIAPALLAVFIGRQKRKQLFRRGFGTAAGGTCSAFVQKVPAVFNYMVQRKIDKPEIRLGGVLHQALAQMIYGGIFVQIVRVRILLVLKQVISVCAHILPFSPVIRAFFQPDEKALVKLRHGGSKQLL